MQRGLKMRKSLQDLCLDSVIQNFDQLMVVYSSSSSIIPTRCFEFLQRLYSKTLIDRLSETDRLRDQYVPFFINPYLKHLDLTSNSFSKIDVIIEQLKLVGSHITSLDIREKCYSEEMIVQLITLLPNVEALYLSNTTSSHNALKCIAKHCPLLHTLDVEGCCITTWGLKQFYEKDENGDIKENHILRKLHIDFTYIGDEGVAFALFHFPALEELDHNYVYRTIFKIYQTHVAKGSFDSLKKYNLRKLTIHYRRPTHYRGLDPAEELEDMPAITDVLKVCSTLCPHISSLSIDDISITQEDVLLCSRFPNLTNIKIYPWTTDVIDYTPLLQTSGQSLIEVDLYRGILSVELLGGCCPKLEKLTLHSVKFGKVDEDTIKSKPAIFPNLKFLMCEGMDLIEESAKSVSFVIGSSPILEILHLNSCRNAGDSFFALILESKCMGVLKELDLSNSYTSLSTVWSIEDVTPSLEKLITEGCTFEIDLFELLNRNDDDSDYDNRNIGVTRHRGLFELLNFTDDGCTGEESTDDDSDFLRSRV